MSSMLWKSFSDSTTLSPPPSISTIQSSLPPPRTVPPFIPSSPCPSTMDESDVVFRATLGKWRAVIVEISRMHKTGRPVLVGTTSVEQSDSLSGQLKEAGIPQENMRKHGLDLLIRHGKPEETLPSLANAFGAHTVKCSPRKKRAVKS